jgi:hypothetical protein
MDEGGATPQPQNPRNALGDGEARHGRAPTTSSTIRLVSDDAVAALRLAGFALAHAAWSVEDGETLCTLALIEVGGQRELARYEADSIPGSVDLAQADLSARLRNGGLAALVFDGFVTPPDGERTDALIVELIGSGGQGLGRVIQPYRAAKRSRIPLIGRASGFAILGEPIVTDDIQVADAGRVLLDAAREHPQAARLFAPGLDR